MATSRCSGGIPPTMHLQSKKELPLRPESPKKSFAQCKWKHSPAFTIHVTVRAPRFLTPGPKTAP